MRVLIIPINANNLDNIAHVWLGSQPSIHLKIILKFYTPDILGPQLEENSRLFSC